MLIYKCVLIIQMNNTNNSQYYAAACARDCSEKPAEKRGLETKSPTPVIEGRAQDIPCHFVCAPFIKGELSKIILQIHSYIYICNHKISLWEM